MYMNPIRIGIVILHYESISDTERCISSIQKNIMDRDTFIIVVDNGSKKNKFNKRKYKDKNIYSISSKENLGFARGNNLGFEFAKEQLKCEIIILSNSDITFEDANFLTNLKTHYINEKFDVAGPKIISVIDGKNQNPVTKIYNSIYDVKRMRIKFYVLYFLSFLNLDNILFKQDEHKKQQKVDLNDFQLHGSCLIFANNYVKKYPGLCDKTFMYGEESILKYWVDTQNLVMKYFSDISVYHKEAASTKKIFGIGGTKRRFFYRWNAKACKTLELIMKGKIKVFN